MDITTFKNSLDKDEAPQQSVYVTALWYDAKGNWKKAHDLIDQLEDKKAFKLHAYLHRKEGDTWNADYWYTKAGTKRPSISLKEEWEQLVNEFLHEH